MKISSLFSDQNGRNGKNWSKVQVRAPDEAKIHFLPPSFCKNMQFCYSDYLFISRPRGHFPVKTHFWAKMAKIFGRILAWKIIFIIQRDPPEQYLWCGKKLFWSKNIEFIKIIKAINDHQTSCPHGIWTKLVILESLESKDSKNMHG